MYAWPMLGPHSANTAASYGLRSSCRKHLGIRGHLSSSPGEGHWLTNGPPQVCTGHFAAQSNTEDRIRWWKSQLVPPLLYPSPAPPFPALNELIASGSETSLQQALCQVLLVLALQVRSLLNTGNALWHFCDIRKGFPPVLGCAGLGL